MDLADIAGNLPQDVLEHIYDNYYDKRSFFQNVLENPENYTKQTILEALKYDIIDMQGEAQEPWANLGYPHYIAKWNYLQRIRGLCNHDNNIRNLILKNKDYFRNIFESSYWDRHSKLSKETKRRLQEIHDVRIDDERHGDDHIIDEAIFNRLVGDYFKSVFYFLEIIPKLMLDVIVRDYVRKDRPFWFNNDNYEDDEDNVFDPDFDPDFDEDFFE